MVLIGPELESAVDALYRVFRPYAALSPPCDGMSSDADIALLESKPLRQLSWSDLERFGRKAITTWGTVDDFRHYLPRLLELVATEIVGCNNPEVVLGKLAYGRWADWPTTERVAVESFLLALWREVRCRPDHPLEVDSCLCGIGRAVDDIEPYLADWRPDRTLGEALQVAAFVESNSRFRKLRDWRPGNGFWDGRPLRQMVEWIGMPDRLTELERAFFSFVISDEQATALSDAVGNLAAIQVALARRTHIPFN